jgi:excisionase family DNA binding protein
MANYYTPEEVAEELRVTRRTVYEWLRTGRLRGLRAGRWWRIRPEDMDAFLRETNGRPERKPLVLRPDPEQARKNQAAIELLRSWREEGDEQEQRETWEYLKKALDEDRLSDRKLFP